jgi:hypothetical protein
VGSLKVSLATIGYTQHSQRLAVLIRPQVRADPWESTKCQCVCECGRCFDDTIYGERSLPLWYFASDQLAGVALRTCVVSAIAHAVESGHQIRQAILAIIACLLLPQHFATMASTSSYLSRPDACSRLLRILGPEQADALLAHSRRWPTYFRMRMMRAKCIGAYRCWTAKPRQGNSAPGIANPEIGLANAESRFCK